MELGRFEIFSEFQINNFLTDIQITLINGTLKAHKLVLAASSEFFKALLNSEVCKEVSTGIINLPSLDYDVFNYIFDYIYMRNPETELNKRLSFYIDVIEASDYLRMLDIIKIIDSKISAQFSFYDLSKEFDRIVPFALSKTKAKIQTDFIDCVNSKNYGDLSHLSASTLLRIFETNNFTVNENLLWQFLLFYMENFPRNCEQESTRQQLIDTIRPGLLDSVHVETFLQFLVKYNYSWADKTATDLRLILSDLPDEHVRNMNFLQRSGLDSLSKIRSIPYLIISASGINNFLVLSKLSLSNLQIELELSIEVNVDNFRCHSFGSHLVFLTKDWDLNRNLGIVLNVANQHHRAIPRWPHQLDDNIDNLHKFWGFSVALFDGNLYLFGGCYFTHAHRTVPTNKIARFNLLDNQWQIVPNLHLKVACWSSSAVKDTRNRAAFFISGGRSPRKYLRSFYVVDIDTGSVIDYPNLPFTIHGHAMEMSRDDVVAIHGGVWDGTVRHEVLLFELAHSVWRIVTLECVLDGVHIDYCCDTAAGSDQRRIAVYELRKWDPKSAGVYLHQIDISGQQAVSGNQSTQLVANLPCGQPCSIMCVLSLKSASPTMVIGEDVFNSAEDD